MNRTFIKMFSFFTFFSVIFLVKSLIGSYSFAAGCPVPCSGSLLYKGVSYPYYSCNNGTACCTCEGCPSWDCTLTWGGGYCTPVVENGEWTCEWSKCNPKYPWICAALDGACERVSYGSCSTCQICTSGGLGPVDYSANGCDGLSVLDKAKEADGSYTFFKNETYMLRTNYYFPTTWGCGGEKVCSGKLAYNPNTCIPVDESTRLNRDVINRITIGSTVFPSDGDKSAAYEWTPTQTGTYKIFCDASTATMGQCAGYCPYDFERLYDCNTEGCQREWKTEQLCGNASVLNRNYIIVNVVDKPNTPPTCSEIIGPSFIGRNTTGSFVAASEDIGGSISSYKWSANGGVFSSTTTNPTNWTSPENIGSYTLNCLVTDGSNATASCPSKTYSTMYYCRTKDNTCQPTGSLYQDIATCQTNLGLYLSGSTTGKCYSYGDSNCSNECITTPTCSLSAIPYSLAPTMTSIITPTVTGSPTQYIWTATAGTLSSNNTSGANTWTAPSMVGNYSVTLTVSNPVGSSSCSVPLVVSQGYNLLVNVTEVNVGGCGSINAVEDVDVKVYYKKPLEGSYSLSKICTTDASGKCTIQNFDIEYTNLRLEIIRSNVDYDSACLTLYPRNIVLSPPNPGDLVEVTIAVEKQVVGAWSTVVDADAYASNISVSIPQLPDSVNIPVTTTPWFNHLVIDSVSVKNIGGYAFSKGGITTDLIHLPSLGGFARTLSAFHDHDDIFLKNFSFDPPSHVSSQSGLLQFNAGAVVNMPVNTFNNIMNNAAGQTISYTVNNVNVPNTGTAILYITEDGSSLTKFTKNFTSQTSGGRVLIISKPGVEVSDTVGFQYINNYTKEASPVIQSSIISSGNITIKSKGTAIPSDIPIMVSAPFVSKNEINLDRDLGTVNNKVYPAQTIKADYPKYLYDISYLERTHKDVTNYTGLRTVDIQLNYPN